MKECILEKIKTHKGIFNSHAKLVPCDKVSDGVDYSHIMDKKAMRRMRVAINKAMRYYSTYDDVYATKIAYPCIKEVLAF